MASNQVRREDLTKSHHTVGQMGGGFGQNESYGNVVADKEPQGTQGQQSHIDQPSLEEIGKYRSIAQQNSMEALMAAENRYAKAKQSQTQRQGQESTGVSVTRGEEAVEETVDEGYGVKDMVMGAAGKTKDTVLSAAEKAKDLLTGKGVVATAPTTGEDKRNMGASQY